MFAVRFSREVEEVNSEECDDKTAEEGQGISAVSGIKTLEKDKRGHNRRARESNIVHRVYTVYEVSREPNNGKGYVHIRGERVQRLVKVVHLDHYTHGGHNTKHISAWVCELVVPSKCEFDRDPKAFDRHNRHGANQRTDRDINDRVCASVARDDSENHENAEHSDGEAI